MKSNTKQKKTIFTQEVIVDKTGNLEQTHFFLITFAYCNLTTHTYMSDII